MTTKQTYSVTVNGQTMKRTTARTYTHAVVARCTDGTVEAVAWSGSFANAAKQLAVHQQTARMPGTIGRNRWDGPENLTVEPVT
jgi:hypothetical protein